MDTISSKVNSAWSKCNALYAKAAANTGISYTELMILYALKTEGSLTQKQISENFGMQKQTVNGTVKQLISKGVLFFDTNQTDRRKKRVVFTEEGKAYADQIIDPILEIEKKVYGIIGEEKSKALYETLDLFNLLFERELNGGAS